MWDSKSVTPFLDVLFFLDETEHSGPKAANSCSNTMARGRPGRKLANRLQKSFLIEKGVKGAQLKKELTLGGRINVKDLDGGLWLNPSVILRRLTVTIGGFKIELLPGPSYAQNVDTSQAECIDDGLSYGAGVAYAVLPGDAENAQNPTPETVAETALKENSSADDAALGLGPYVNPNEVQSSNGTVTGNASKQDTKLDNQSVCGKQKPVSKEKEDIEQPQSSENNEKAGSIKTDGKVKQQTVVKSPLKSKQGVTSNKNKDLAPVKPNDDIKGQNATENTPSTVLQREEVHKIKGLKEKKDITPLKRPAETIQSEHAPKMQKVHVSAESKAKPKLPSTPSSAAKKSPSSINRVDPQGPPKHIHPQSTSKVEAAHQAHSRPGLAVKTADEGGLEKPKVKKPEKILQRQKSKNAKSISVEEPQLFIPDNAPVVKKEASEEQAVNSESVWDGNNCCGLCKKHHNNM